MRAKLIETPTYFKFLVYFAPSRTIDTYYDSSSVIQEVNNYHHFQLRSDTSRNWYWSPASLESDGQLVTQCHQLNVVPPYINHIIPQQDRCIQESTVKCLIDFPSLSSYSELTLDWKGVSLDINKAVKYISDGCFMQADRALECISTVGSSVYSLSCHDCSTN